MLLGGGVLAGRLTGQLEGVAGVAVLTVLVLAVPTSRELSRRALLAGCLLLGWTQVLYWWPLPVSGLGRVTVGLVGLAAGLGFWVGAGPRPRRRARRLLPRLRWTDLTLPATVLFGMAGTEPWLRPGTATRTLGMLMDGWDNVAHFSMVHMIRRFGVTVDALPPPGPGATWQFDSYPQGFHAAAAAVLELLLGPGDVGLPEELVAYGNAMAILVVAAVTTVVAGCCALPAVRRRPALAPPAAALVATVFFFGPGAQAINGGIANFAVACCLVVAAILVAVRAVRVPAPLTLAALGGAVLGVATYWALLVVLVVPVAVMLLVPLRRSRWSVPAPHAAAAIVVVVLVLGGLARTAAVLARIRAADPLTIDGSRVPVDVGFVTAVALAVLGVGVLLLRGGRRRGSAQRAAMTGLVPLLGAVAAGALIVLQVRATGQITYYGLKFLLAMEIVLPPVLVVGLLSLARDLPRRRGALVETAASLVVALGLTQAFGLTTTALGRFGVAAEAQGARDVVHQRQVLASPPAAADLVTRVGSVTGRIPPAGAYYVDVPPEGRVNSVLVAQWFLALTDTWTAAANSVAAATTVHAPADVPAVAQRILTEHPGALVVVPADSVAAVRDALPPRWASRVTGL